MEDQAASLLAILKRPSASMDSRLQQFNNLKSGIKHQRVSDAAQIPIFECVRLAIASQTSSTLVSTGFVTLGHLIKRLNLQDQAATTATQATKLYPALLERLGDARESHRVAASQALMALWPCSPTDVERVIREGALAGSNSKARDMAMLWLVAMHKTENFPFKSFVPYLVTSLEDADGVTRDTAKAAIIELFRNAPDHAKADLKKQMNHRGVRKTIVNHIVSQLDPSSSEPDLKASVSTAPISANHLNPDKGIADSLLMAEAPPPPETTTMDPIHLHSQRDVDDLYREMHPHFEGRESEGNWMARDKSVLKLRRINKGNAPTEFPVAYVTVIKSLMDGILKVANSLRTTMSTNGCQLIQELARTLGHSMDPMTELLLQNFIKTAAAVKNIAAQNGNVTVDTILSHVSYNHRIMGYISAAVEDKNVQPRIYSAGWLRTILRKHTTHQTNIEHSGGADTMEKSIKKGLLDANPKVRENMRATYWAFAKAWPERGKAIMSTLDAKPRDLLEKDPNNPNASSRNSALSQSTSALSQARPSVKGAIAAQRKALAARKLPERPSSAQSAFSPARPPSSSSVTSRAPSSLSHAPRPPSSATNRSTQANPSTSTTGGSSLMSAPVRRPRRPELSRPATADPYASRRGGRPVTPSASPDVSPAKKNTTVKKPAVPKSGARPRSQRGQSPANSPARSKSRAGQAASRGAPSGEHAPTDSPATSPSKDESMTIVMPMPKTQVAENPPAAFRSRPNMEKTMSVDMGLATLADDENFTMVIPPVKLNQPEGTGLRPSPGKGSRIRSPQKSPERAGGAENGAGDEVKVYEDPFVGGESFARQPSEDEKPVLEEVAVNEKQNDADPVTRGSPLPAPEDDDHVSSGHHKSASSGNLNIPVADKDLSQQDRAEILRSRRLLASGTERVRAKTLDAHGFRRLQELVKSKNDAVWAAGDLSSSDPPSSPATSEKRFQALLLGLLDYLEAPLASLKTQTTGPPSSATAANASTARAQNLKTQALATTRAMLSLHRRASAPFLPRALCAVLRARAQYDSAAHIAAELERTAEELARWAAGRGECVDAVLDLLDHTVDQGDEGEEDNERRAKTIAAGLDALAKLLRAGVETKAPRGPALGEQRTERLGRAAVWFLDDASPDVRKADMEVCLAMHERLGTGGEEGGGVWKALEGAREGHLNLIAYYVARRANG